MNVLVCGGTGYIGSHICVELLDAGYEVTVIDDFSNSKPEVLEHIKEITGKDPDYFECHAVISQNFFIALRNVAKKYGLFYENVLFDQEFEKENNIYGIAMAKLNEQMLYDPKEYIENSLEFIRNHDVSVMVFHPGYLDQYILTHSSFTLIRAMECDFLCSSWLKDWLKEYQIELTDFRKVKNA